MTKILSAIFVTALLLGCGKVDYDIPGQRAMIVNFLNSQNREFTEQSGVYKYTYYTQNNTPVANEGDSVYFYFSGYTFYNGLRGMHTTNIASDAAADSLDVTFRDLTPRGIKVGSSNIIKGIDLGIRGSAAADSMMLFITSDLAYGEKRVGIVPPGTTVAFKIVIDKIVK